MIKMFRKFICCRRTTKDWNCCRKYRYKCNEQLLNINEIRYDELITKVKEGAILIDVRTRQEFLEGHLEGAILIPYYEISKKVADIIPNKNQAIIVYCQNGGRSQKAYKTLNNMGYNNIYNLKSGIEGSL